MKILAREYIKSAEEPGSIWYKITREDLLNNMLWKDNVWISERLKYYPLDDSINIEDLDGSYATEDTLYFLVTDYSPIIIDGEEIEPEEALEEYSLKDIENYINDNPPKDIIQRITDSDISWAGIDIDTCAKDLLDIESFSKVVEDAQDIDLI